MGKTTFWVLLITGIITACHYPENTDQIDYADLKTLDAQVVQEITESENFLPGRLKDIIIDSEGNILVSDWASRSITQLDAEDNFIATIAEQGEGPGELGRYFRMRPLDNDTVLVQQQTMEQEYFAKGANGQYEFIRSVSPERGLLTRKEVIGHKSDTTYYARVTTSVGSMQQAAKNEREYRNAVLAETSLSGKTLTDSLKLLKKGTRHYSEWKSGLRMDQVPYRYDDRFVSLKDGFMIARPDSTAFYLYNDDAELQRKIPFNVKPRSVTEEDLDYVLKDRDKNIRSELEALINEEKPPFLDVWATDRYIWLKTNIGEDGKQVVIVDFEGNPVGKFKLPEIDKIEVIRENYIYTIHEDPKQGNTIRKYEVKI